MGLINIHYESMMDGHPGMGFLDLIDGPIRDFHRNPKTQNSCASKISYALNAMDGHMVWTEGDYGKGGIKVKRVRTLQDSVGFHYIFSTKDLYQYLNNRYGPPQRFAKTSLIGDRNGVIIFEPQVVVGHTDLWVNGDVHRPELFAQDWLEQIKKELCYFWDLLPA